MTRPFVWAFVFTAFVGGFVRADDWPQFRGPKRDGISAEKGLLAKWPAKGPSLVWSFKTAGLGFSSCAIRDGVLYTLGTNQGEKDEILLVLDATKGSELWTAKIGPVANNEENSSWGDGPRGTPTLDGNLLFALGSQGDLVCVDVTKKGAEVWRKNLITDFGGEMMSGWGYSESPLVDGDNLIVTPGGKKGTMVALDKKTGKLVWQSTELKHKAPYSSIMAADIDGVRQYVQLSYVSPTKGGYVNGIAAKDGKLLWQESIFKKHSYAAAPNPIIQGNLVYVTTGYGGGCHLFEIGKGFKVKDLYVGKTQKAVKNTHGGVVLLGGNVFGHSENIGWFCQELKTGKVSWEDKDSFDTRSASTIAADGLLYLYTEDGEAVLAKQQATAQGTLDSVNSFKIPETSKYPGARGTSQSAKAWNQPVIANGHLFVRDCELIFCYDIRAK